MFYDFNNGKGTFRILWKSAARWRRLGLDGMLEWLDKEIWRIPNHQKTLNIDSFAYRRWIENKERYSFDSDVVESNLKISIILVIETDSSVSRTIASVLGQYYPHWELLVIGDSFDDTRWNDRRIIHAANKVDDSSCTVGLSSATGEWIVFADANTLFSPHLLGEMAAEILKCPDLSLIYSDEDTIDRYGRRSNPYFKSGFNIDLLYSVSYIGKSFAVKKQTIVDAGGFKGGLQTVSWEYDLVLRVLETKGDKAIHHLPKVLFHFQQQAYDAELRQRCERQILIRHFERTNERTTVEDGHCLLTRHVHWSYMKPFPSVSIIVPTRDYAGILRQCVESIVEKTAYPSYEILIVDNQSVEKETLDYFDEISHNDNIKVLRYDCPFNYSAINNFAVGKAEGEIIVLLNNDVEVISSEWLNELVSNALRPEIGCVGAMLYYPDDTIQHAGVICGLGDVAGHAHKYMVRGSSGYFNRACVVQNFLAVTAACLAIRKKVFEEAGGLDEQNLIVAYNDVDLCLKVYQMGYRNLWTPYAELYHHESKSRGKDDTPEKKARYKREVDYMRQRWGEVLNHDPYYHPHFSRTAEQFQLRRMK